MTFHIPPLNLPVRKAESGILFQDFPGCDLSRFSWNGSHVLCVQGVAIEKPLGAGQRHIEIISIWSPFEGRGAIRSFITLLKQHYYVIDVLGIVEPILSDALKRYQFQHLNTPPLVSMRWQSPTCLTPTQP